MNFNNLIFTNLSRPNRIPNKCVQNTNTINYNNLVLNLNKKLKSCTNVRLFILL